MPNINTEQLFVMHYYMPDKFFLQPAEKNRHLIIKVSREHAAFLCFRLIYILAKRTHLNKLVRDFYP